MRKLGAGRMRALPRTAEPGNGRPKIRVPPEPSVPATTRLQNGRDGLTHPLGRSPGLRTHSHAGLWLEKSPWVSSVGKGHRAVPSNQGLQILVPPGAGFGSPNPSSTNPCLKVHHLFFFPLLEARVRCKGQMTPVPTKARQVLD